ncbi:hypothetical protein K458DRAFT_382766 [Lentithecium fluviatile CBS 122367]|uniref:Uncharacterized protein n=1 Tax=Lentithecium fluviatile CBS 122367 TaxID=1168545 RepID=A0A6G1JM44_9PLEO|nr:hypothetical protein K458DRAFT_382766 [Lentithecium fluviatile CBS 122367]
MATLFVARRVAGQHVLLPIPSALTAYPFPTSIHTIRQHSDKQLFLTLRSPAAIYCLEANADVQTSPGNPNNEAARVNLHTFQDEKACYGLVRLDASNYLVVTSEMEILPQVKLAPGSFKVWRVDTAK